MQQVRRHVDRLTGHQNDALAFHPEINLAFQGLHNHRVHAVVLMPRLPGGKLHKDKVPPISVNKLLSLRLILKGGKLLGELREDDDATFVGACHGFTFRRVRRYFLRG